ncbi:MAG: hypothetical protein ACFFG0_12255 [Candidatus Thorarchaeota archaeon]
MFWNEKEITIYLVWQRLAGGDYLKKIYQKKEEAEFKKKQLIERGYGRTWIQELKFTKEEINYLKLIAEEDD